MSELVRYLMSNMYLDFQGEITVDKVREFLRQDDSREARKVLAKILEEEGVDDMLLTLADCLARAHRHRRERKSDARSAQSVLR